MRDWQCHLDNAIETLKKHYQWKNLFFKKNSRRAYNRKITENINKLTKYVDLRNKSSLESKNYKNMNIKTKTVSNFLIESTNDQDEVQNISDICNRIIVELL